MIRRYVILVLCFVLSMSGLFCMSAYGQTERPAGTYGTDFWLAFLSNNSVAPDDKNLKLTVYAVSDYPVKVIVALGTNNDKLGEIIIPEGGGFGQLEKITPTGIYPETNESETVVNRGIRIYAEDGRTPFCCYAICETGGTGAGSMRDATLLLPADVLGREYIVQTFPEDGTATEFAIVAMENSTKITVVPAAQTFKNKKPGTTLSATLKKGQVYMVKSAGKSASITNIDMSGSTICSDKPIAVFTGNVATKIPDKDAYSADHTFEQMLPISMWEPKSMQLYVARAGGTKNNRVQITALYDNTDVKYVRPMGTGTITLNRGESLPDPIQLNDYNPNMVITASMPVVCYTYLGCGADNQITEIDEHGDVVSYPWGNPANAMVVPWSAGAKAMSFYTSEIENHTEGAKQRHFVQVVVAKGDAGKITLDGTAVSSSSFSVFSGDANMMYANLELTTYGKHRLVSSGGVISGFVNAMTAESRAYEYTLGFDPPFFADSLYIEDKDNFMSKSYDIERMPSGWYQRQYEDWPVGKEHLDTAVVCDSTLLHFFEKLPKEHESDSIVWKIYKCNNKGVRIDPAVMTVTTSISDKPISEHRAEYQFILDPQSEKAANKRDKFTIFHVDVERYEKHILCTDKPDYVADTSRTIVRVNRIYNDTTWQILCTNQTLKFFKSVPAERFVKTLSGTDFNDETTFKYGTPDDLTKKIIEYKEGDNTYSRWYKTINGCDSIVTLKLFGCSPIFQHKDTVICEKDMTSNTIYLFDDYDSLRVFIIVRRSQSDLLQEMKSDHTLTPYEKVYMDERLSNVCLANDPLGPQYLQHVTDFKGCEDKYELNVKIMPHLSFPLKPGITEWCPGKAFTYRWERADGTLIKEIDESTVTFDENNMAYLGTTSLWHNPCPDCPGGKCPMETDTLILHIANDINITKHICQTETYTHTFATGDSKKYNGWDYLEASDLWPNAIVETHSIEVKGSGDGEGCTYLSTLTMYVHPAYVETKNLHTEIRETVDWCVSKNADDYYVWQKHNGKVWCETTKDSVPANQIPINKTGTFVFVDSLRTKTCTECKTHSCDSVHRLWLHVHPTYYNDDGTLDMSSEDYYVWVGEDTIFAGSSAVIPEELSQQYKVVRVNGNVCYTHTHKTKVAGCDSIRTICLSVGEVFRDTAYAPVCENCEYEWYIQDPNTGANKTILITDVPKAGETRWYSESYKTEAGFDSVYNLQLTGFPTKYIIKQESACQASEYIWPGKGNENLYLVDDDGSTQIITPAQIKDAITQQPGIYTIRDSAQTDTLFINPKTKQKVPVHCDSVWELSLMVLPIYTWQYNHDAALTSRTLCSNDTLLWSHRLWVGYDFDEKAHPLEPASNVTLYDSIVYIPNILTSQEQIFHDSIPTDGTHLFGCDSTSYIDIYISHFEKLHQARHIGDNDSIWVFGGKGGTFRWNGQDSVTREDLIPSATIDYSDATRSNVEKFLFMDSLNTVDGCDSLVWDTVYIHPSYRFDTTAVICSNNYWSWRPNSPNAADFVNMNTKVTGTYFDSLKTQVFGIDSVFVLHLTVEPYARHNFSADLCKNDTIYWEYQKIFFPPQQSEGIKDHTDTEVTYYTGADCDSVLILGVDFYNYYHFPQEMLHQIDGFESDSICRNDPLIWISPGDSEPHTIALRGERGESYESLPTDTLGWITIYDSLHTTSLCHCDSTYKLRYYVKESFQYFDTLTICSNDTLEWHNQKFSSPFAATLQGIDANLTTVGACDSIYYLTLYVRQAYDSIRYDTICGDLQPFLWEGHNLDSWLHYHYETLKDTLPVDTFLYSRYPTNLNCDSVFQLYLNVRPIRTTEWFDTICIGETYVLNDKRLTTTGIHFDTIITNFGCDSIAKVHLAVVPATHFVVEPMIICADYGEYEMVFSFDPEKGYPPREIRVVYDSLAQAWGFPKDTVTIPATGGSVRMNIPETDALYVRPNNYSATIFFDNGTCDDLEMQRVDFSFEVDYPSFILEQKWADAIGILSSEYNGDYTFSTYQWYKNGTKLVGETKPYYFAPQYLEIGAEYSVELTREGDTLGIMTCSLVAQERNNTLTPQKPYVSVVPTLVVKDNPIVHIMCSQKGGVFKIYNPYGSLIQSGRFEPGGYNAQEVRLPAMSGIYLFELNQEEGEVRSVKVIVH